MLSDFSSYFEIMAVLNLGYAGSEYFRKTVNLEILKLSKYYSPAIDTNIRSIESKIVVLENGNGNSIDPSADPNMGQDGTILKSIRTRFDIGKKQIEDDANSSESVTRAFKSMFLITSFYCFYILILGGFENYISRAYYVDYLLYSCHLVLIYDLIILVRSFIPRYKSKNIKPIFTVLLFIVFTFVGYCCFTLLNPQSELIQEEYNILIAIFLAQLSYWFHFGRAWISKTYLEIKYRRLFKDVKRQLDDIDKALESTGE